MVGRLVTAAGDAMGRVDMIGSHRWAELGRRGRRQENDNGSEEKVRVTTSEFVGQVDRLP
jgi:hypothetical protein